MPKYPITPQKAARLLLNWRGIICQQESEFQATKSESRRRTWSNRIATTKRAIAKLEAIAERGNT